MMRRWGRSLSAFFLIFYPIKCECVSLSQCVVRLLKHAEIETFIQHDFHLLRRNSLSLIVLQTRSSLNVSFSFSFTQTYFCAFWHTFVSSFLWCFNFSGFSYRNKAFQIQLFWRRSNIYGLHKRRFGSKASTFHGTWTSFSSKMLPRIHFTFHLRLLPRLWFGFHLQDDSIQHDVQQLVGELWLGSDGQDAGGFSCRDLHLCDVTTQLKHRETLCLSLLSFSTPKYLLTSVHRLQNSPPKKTRRQLASCQTGGFKTKVTATMSTSSVVFGSYLFRLFLRTQQRSSNTITDSRRTTRETMKSSVGIIIDGLCFRTQEKKGRSTLRFEAYSWPWNQQLRKQSSCCSVWLYHSSFITRGSFNPPLSEQRIQLNPTLLPNICLTYLPLFGILQFKSNQLRRNYLEGFNRLKYYWKITFCLVQIFSKPIRVACTEYSLSERKPFFSSFIFK